MVSSGVCDGKEAVEIFRQQSDSITAILLDMTMPVMNEAFHLLRAIRADVPIAISTGSCSGPVRWHDRTLEDWLETVRVLNVAGRRMKLANEDTYAFGAHRGGHGVISRKAVSSPVRRSCPTWPRRPAN